MRETVAFLNIAMHGRVNPTLPIVAELVRRGHTVSLFAAEGSDGADERYAFPAAGWEPSPAAREDCSMPPDRGDIGALFCASAGEERADGP